MTRPTQSRAGELATAAARLLADLRSARPLVQAVTNFVSMDVAANALLAIGASPAMVHAPEEAEEFIALANALVVNIGTPSKSFLAGMEAAALAAHMVGRPWVLDPIGAGTTRLRDTAVRQLLRHRPTIIRGNASEILAVARTAGLHHDAFQPKDVESAHTIDEARAMAIKLARHQFCIVAATGAADLITDGEEIIDLANGAPIMAKVTALGCALSAVVAAFAALTPDYFAATAAAIAVYGIAGEMAAEKAVHPGSFRVAFLDMLNAIGEEDIVRRLKVL